MKKVIIHIVSICSFFSLSAQTENDSLWSIWSNEDLHDSIRMSALFEHIKEDVLYNNPDSALSLARRMLEYSTIKGNRTYQATSYYLFGKSLSEMDKTLDARKNYVQALRIYENIGDKRGQSRVLWDLGLTHYFIGQYVAAVENYSKCLMLLKELNDTFGISGILTNIGLIYEAQEDYSKALEYYEKGAIIIEESGSSNDVALNKIGDIYVMQGDYPKALKYFNKRLKATESDAKGEYYNYSIGTCSALNGIGDIYSIQGNYDLGLDYYLQSLDVATKDSNDYLLYTIENKIGLLYVRSSNGELGVKWCAKALKRAHEAEIKSLFRQRSACECLYKAYKLLGDNARALEYHELFYLLDDSLELQETAKSLIKMEFTKQMFADSLQLDEDNLKIKLAHQNEILRKDKIRNVFISLGVLLLLLAIGLYSWSRYIQRAKARVEEERKRSDKLLLNILPAEVAEELKEKGNSTARAFAQVSILFTDFIGFTKLSEKMNAQELVAEINIFFKAFDAICQKYQIEKIKTIGDSYMAAGGLSYPMHNSVKNTILAALEMANFVTCRNFETNELDKPPFEMRVGIHTGSVVAGIVGNLKFQYDIWGDAVNTASRMESAGSAGRVNISKTTYHYLKNDPQFEFELRGEIHTKGKGPIEMWFVNEVL